MKCISAVIPLIVDNKLKCRVAWLCVLQLSGSVMTMYNADYGNVEVQGNIQFSINYVQKLREFHIFVAECRDLAAVDPKRGRSDPWVKQLKLTESKFSNKCFHTLS